MIDFASFETFTSFGNNKLFARTFWNISSLFFPLKGASPNNISYINTPKVHQSTEEEWPKLDITSGAM